MRSLQQPPTASDTVPPAPLPAGTPAPQNLAVPAPQQQRRPSSLDVLQARTRLAPTTMACLRCQLIGRRRMLCSRADVCAELPHSFAVGPILLAAWAATTVAFIISVL